MKMWPALIIGVTLSIVISSGIGVIEAVKARRKLDEFQHHIELDRQYTQGFANGINATLKYVYYDTNTGKISIEMTNVLGQMHNTNAFYWTNR